MEVDDSLRVADVKLTVTGLLVDSEKDVIAEPDTELDKFCDCDVVALVVCVAEMPGLTLPLRVALLDQDNEFERDTDTLALSVHNRALKLCVLDVERVCEAEALVRDGVSDALCDTVRVPVVLREVVKVDEREWVCHAVVIDDKVDVPL